MTRSAVVPQLLTMDQLAERLGVTRRHVRRLVAERRVPFLRVGRFIRFDPRSRAGSTPTASPARGPRSGRQSRVVRR